MTATELKLMSRLPALRARAIGKPFAIRQDKNTLTRGVVTDVEFADFHYTGRSVRMIFKVTMECGSAKAVKSFHTASVPA